MMRSWIHFTRGRFVRQARVGLGDLREEHLSRHGFAGPVAMLYRTDGPNEIVRIEGDYRRRQIDSADVVAADASDPRGGTLTLLSNDDVAIAISRRRQAMPYCYRNIDMDEVMLTHAHDDPQGRRPAASRSRRRVFCTALRRRSVPNFRPGAPRERGGRAPALVSTPTGRWTSRPSLLECRGDPRSFLGSRGRCRLFPRSRRRRDRPEKPGARGCFCLTHSFLGHRVLFERHSIGRVNRSLCRQDASGRAPRNSLGADEFRDHCFAIAGFIPLLSLPKHLVPPDASERGSRDHLNHGDTEARVA
jgi:hypothetical protein